VTPKIQPLPKKVEPLPLILFVLPKDSDFLGKAQLPNPLLQELSLRFLLGQRQSFLVRGPSLSGPAEPAVHICTG